MHRNDLRGNHARHAHGYGLQLSQLGGVLFHEVGISEHDGRTLGARDFLPSFEGSSGRNYGLVDIFAGGNLYLVGDEAAIRRVVDRDRLSGGGRDVLRKCQVELER
jgi:hypothetical protein